VNRLLARMERLASLLARGAQRSRIGGSHTQALDLKSLAASAQGSPPEKPWDGSTWRCDRHAAVGHHEPHTAILLSRYEHMVDDFFTWLNTFLSVLPNLATFQRQHLRETLFATFAGGFVVDGGHRHSLKPGANLVRLRSRGLAALSANKRVSSLLGRLGYSSTSPRAHALPDGWAS
jgi:hypothetical protein